MFLGEKRHDGAWRPQGSPSSLDVPPVPSGTLLRHPNAMADPSVSKILQQFPVSARARRATDSPISILMRLALEDPEILSLAAGLVDVQTLPDDLVRGAFDKVFSTPERAKAALQYGSTVGLRGLREAMAARLASQGMPTPDPDTVLISNGGQQSLFTITDVVVDAGDVVLLEDPTYFVMMDVMKAAGARVYGVATDDQGMIPSALAERFEDLRRDGVRDRLRMLYVMSYFGNPTGANATAERRRELWETIQREIERDGLFLTVEDASYRDLALDGVDEPFLKSFDTDNEYILATGTFSKAFSPGLRLGWAHGPAALIKAMVRQKGNHDFGTANLNQRIMAELLENGGYEQAAERFRARYITKRDSMVQAIREFWPEETQFVRPRGGLYVWAKLPGICTNPGTPFFEKSLAEKVIYVPGDFCFCANTQGPRPDNAMRLCYGVIGIDQIREAIARMGRVMEGLAGA
jgi:2-aminoadipate transaminase